MTPHSILAAALITVPLTDRVALRSVFYNVSGVYVLYCFKTGRYYIGSSVNIYLRVSDYIQPAYQAARPNHPIIRAILKHGLENFQVLLLNECPSSDVRAAEQGAIDLYKPDYNQLKIVGSSVGFNHSDETKAKLREQQTGTVRSDDSRARQAATITGAGNHRYGIIRSDEEKEYLRMVALARPTSNKPSDAIIVEHTNTGLSTEYRSIRVTANNEPYTRHAITAALKGTRVIPGLRVYYAPKPKPLLSIILRKPKISPFLNKIH
jgi:group I intron endonuclease